MVEGAEGQVPLRTPEKQEVLPRPHLVTGGHMDSLGEVNGLENKINQGDLSVHVWDKDIAGRLKASNPQPIILSIDGLSPQPPGNTRERDYDAGQKRHLWKVLPARPSEINASNEVYVVAGDLVGTNDEALKKLFAKASASPSAGKSGHDELTKERVEISSVAQSTLPDLITFVPSAAAVIVAMTTAVALADKKYTQTHGESTDAKSYTRRSVLKLLGFTAGTVVSVGLLGKYGPHMTIPKALNDNIIDTVVRIAKREEADQRSLDGRTALLIEKGITAAQYLKEADVTVVAGSAHDHNKDNLLNSPQARAGAIAEYAKVLLEIVDKASDKAGLSAENKLSARGILLDNLTYGQILKVSDTGLTHVTPGEVDQTLDRSIKFQSDFMLISKDVNDALDGLRQGAPKVYGPFGMNIER